MANNGKIGRDTRTGQFLTKPLGRAKATKFSLVEGVSLTEESARIIHQHQSSGKNGTALRSAIAGSFRQKQ
jgi:hypothetical protein